MDELCSGGACAGITTNPVADLARLDARLQKTPLSGWVYDGAGRRRRGTLTSDGLLDILEAGDLNPALRALLPAAVRSALQGDAAPLLRLHLLSEGLIPNLPSENGVGSQEGEAASGVDEILVLDDDLRGEPVPLVALGHGSHPPRGSTRLHQQPAGVGVVPVRRRHRVHRQPRLGVRGMARRRPPPRARARCRTSRR